MDAIKTSFKPDPAAVADLHAYVRWYVATEKKREVAKSTRARCVELLQHNLLSDMEALDEVRKTLKRRGWT